MLILLYGQAEIHVVIVIMTDCNTKWIIHRTHTIEMKTGTGVGYTCSYTAMSLMAVSLIRMGQSTMTGM